MINRTTGHHILNSKFGDLNFSFLNFLDSLGIISSGILTLLLTFGTRDNHLARLKNKSGSSVRVLHPHDYGCKSLWIVLSISTFQSDVFQNQFLIEFSSRDQILQNWALELRLLIGSIWFVGSCLVSPWVVVLGPLLLYLILDVFWLLRSSLLRTQIWTRVLILLVLLVFIVFVC